MHYGKHRKDNGARRSSGKENQGQEQVEVRTPKIDLFETERGYYLRLSLPGVKKENLKISFNTQGLLEIKGKVVTIIPEHLRKVVVQEIFQGPFYRTVQIPGVVDKQNVKFSYHGGILEVILQKLS